MNIPEIDQKLATIKAMHIQYVNGYHLSDKDIKDFNEALAWINDLALAAKPVELAKNYRADQIMNRMTTQEDFKLKLTNENSHTNWLNVTPEEVKQIAKLLNKEEK